MHSNAVGSCASCATHRTRKRAGPDSARPGRTRRVRAQRADNAVDVPPLLLHRSARPPGGGSLRLQHLNELARRVEVDAATPRRATDESRLLARDLSAHPRARPRRPAALALSAAWVRSTRLRSPPRTRPFAHRPPRRSRSPRRAAPRRRSAAAAMHQRGTHGAAAVSKGSPGGGDDDVRPEAARLSTEDSRAAAGSAAQPIGWLRRCGDRSAR